MMNLLRDCCLVRTASGFGGAWLGLLLVGALAPSLTSATAAGAGLMPKQLRCEYLVNPPGIDEMHPRLSWLVESGQRGQRQTAYQILVASDETRLRKDQGDLWDSGKVVSGQSIHLPYAGKPLVSLISFLLQSNLLAFPVERGLINLQHLGRFGQVRGACQNLAKMRFL